ncbi:uncharacterized protein LOC108602007 [Drosophila busckii]|nr:uncharacterized protein LOC108602007 [Drosophila busckii]
MSATDWLTHAYVEQKLREYLKDEELQLEQLHSMPATAAGENYASVMTRINVTYKDKEQQSKADTFLIKTTFADKDPAAHIFGQYGIYVREMNMYELVLPKLAKIIREELGDERNLFASTVDVDRERNSIIFEDMSQAAYSVVDRLHQVDLEHAKLVLEKLAIFHASAAKLNERQPGMFSKDYDRCFFNRYTRAYEPIMKNMLKALACSLEDDELVHQQYAAKLSGLADHIMEYSERAMEFGKDDFVTLCHGDLWTTNMMFQYDGAKPKNAIFIDFQFSVWNSPAIDLHYFFSTSLPDDLRLHRQPELVQYYHQHLTQALSKVKYQGHVPSLFDFQMQFKQRAFYAIFCSLVFLAAMLYSGTEHFSMEQALSTLKKDEAIRISLYKTKLMQSKIRNSLPFFDHIGLLDEM